MKKSLKIVLFSVSAIVLALAVLVGTAMNRLSKAAGESFSLAELVKQSFSGEMKLKGVTNFLLLGIDNEDPGSDGHNGNADGIMLVSVNADTRELILTSFMRDTKVSVSDYRRDKLTTVYHDGGIEEFLPVFEKNFGIAVDHYAIFNYFDIIDLVDALGGIDIDVADEEIPDIEAKIRAVADKKGVDYVDYLINWYGPGVIHFNGLQTAGYLRIRPAYGNYDSGRTERARYVVSRLMETLSGKPVSEMIDFAGMLYSQIETDMPESETMKLALNAGRIMRYDRISDKIPMDGTYSSEDNGNGYYAVPDFEVNNAHLYASIYEGKH